MTANERRMALLEVLCERRFDKQENLAFEFGVSKRTIEYDVIHLSLSYPIYTQTGKYGGVYVVDGFKLGKKYLSEQQLSTLKKIIKTKISDDDKIVLESIIKEFSIK